MGVGLADVASIIAGSLLVFLVGIKKTLIYSFLISSVGGLIILVYGLGH